jgi:hypothetical protein
MHVLLGGGRGGASVVLDLGGAALALTFAVIVSAAVPCYDQRRGVYEVTWLEER